MNDLGKSLAESSIGVLFTKSSPGSWRVEMSELGSDPLHQFHPLHPHNPSSVGPDRARGPCFFVRSTHNAHSFAAPPLLIE